MTRRMATAVANPHVDILGHCTGRIVVGRGRPESTFDAELVFHACAALRHGGRDQLPARAARPAPPPAHAGGRAGLPVRHRHRRPRPRPARVAALRRRPGRRSAACPSTGSSTPGAPTSCWPGPAAHADRPVASAAMSKKTNKRKIKARKNKANHGTQAERRPRLSRRASAAPARVDDVVDVLHGVEVADPYRWLEDGDDPEAVAWADGPERPHPGRPRRPPRPARRCGRSSSACCGRRSPARPGCAGDRVFALERGGDRDQAVLTVRPVDDPDGAEPARCSTRPAARPTPPSPSTGTRPRPTAASSPTAPPRAATSAARCGCSTSTPATTSPTSSPHCRAASVAWLPDGSAFAYTRYPDPRRRVRPRYGRSGTSSATDPAGDDLALGRRRPARPDGLARRARSAPTGAGCSLHVVARLEPHRRPPRSTGPPARRTTVDRGRRGGHRASRSSATASTAPPPSTRPGAGWSPPPSTTRAELAHARPRGRRRHRGRRRRRRARCSWPSPRWPWAGSTATRSTAAAARRSPCPGLGSRRRPRRRRRRRAGRPRRSSRSPAPPSLCRWDAGRVDAGPAGRAPGPSTPTPTSSSRCATASTDGTEVPMFLLRRADTDARRPTRPPSSPATAASPSPRPRRGHRWAWPWPTPAASTPWPASGAAPRTARTGTGPACGEHKQQVFDDFAAAADWLVAEGLTSPGPPRHPGRQQRRPARGRGPDPAARPVPGRALRRAAARHGAVPAVPHRPALDPRVRRPRRARGLRLAARLLAVPPRRRRHLLPGRAAHDGRVGQPGRPVPRPQVRRPPPGGDRRAATSTRSCCGSRRGPATARASRCGKQADEAADVLAFLFDQLGVRPLWAPRSADYRRSACPDAAAGPATCRAKTRSQAQ